MIKRKLDVVHRFLQFWRRKREKQNLKKKIEKDFSWMKFLEVFEKNPWKNRLFLRCEARLKLGRKKWRENILYAKIKLCARWYENCNNYEIYIYNNYEKLRSFRKKPFYFSWRVFLNFVFCWLEVFFNILGSAWYFFC